jgi:hypothetical protein
MGRLKQSKAHVGVWRPIESLKEHGPVEGERIILWSEGFAMLLAVIYNGQLCETFTLHALHEPIATHWMRAPDAPPRMLRDAKSISDPA